jgi:hypothetical protein
MSGKIKISHIINDHISTLYDYRTGKIDWWDITTLFIGPAIISITVVFLGLRLDSAEVNILVTSLSIFAALLFNLLLLTHSIVAQNGEEGNTRRLQLLEEVYSHISYTILISVLTIVLLISFVVIPCRLFIVDIVFSLVVYSLVLNFLATLVLILSRVHTMLNSEFTEGK